MFTIKIEETGPVRKTIGKQWKVTGQVEKTDTTGKSHVVDVYDYTPEVETVVDETRTVLLQEVNELNLPAVIAAINGLCE